MNRKLIPAVLSGAAAVLMMGGTAALASSTPAPVMRLAPSSPLDPNPIAAPAGAHLKAGVSPAASAPCSDPTTFDMFSEYNTNYWWKLSTSSNILEQVNEPTQGHSWFCWVQYHSNTYGNALQFYEVGGPDPGYCLGWNQGRHEYDVRKIACDSSFTTGTWDLFQNENGGNNYAQYFTIYNWQYYQGCMTSEGLNVPILPTTTGGGYCNTSDPSTYWQMIYEFNQ